ncbi:MAG: transglutaminase domain-containing protein [Candidatus Nanohaloarchaea archaeon]|nr:transglutaminase domain-containing protein [Candidatus Nanohaloarchaea archaeon]
MVVEERRKALKQLAVAAGTGIVGGSTFLRFKRSDRLAPEMLMGLYDDLGIDGQLRPFTDVPRDYMDYLQPDHPVVEGVAGEAELLSGDGDMFLDLDVDMRYPETDSTIQRDWVKPAEYFEEGVGDCEDYALGFASVLEALGYSSRFVAGAVEYGDEPRGLHAVAETRIDGEWYVTGVSHAERLYTREEFDDTAEYWNPIAMFGVDLPYQVYEPGVQG